MDLGLRSHPALTMHEHRKAECTFLSDVLYSPFFYSVTALVLLQNTHYIIVLREVQVAYFTVVMPRLRFKSAKKRSCGPGPLLTVR